ncbi:MAG TPA: hypothetical protein VGR76_15820, partial [Candidatus Angelobacter sp.]|nr:hypothetical protein [Candidatus Angelobacter sp.]
MANLTLQLPNRLTTNSFASGTKRRLCFRLAAVVAVPILLLGGTEAVLRLAGYGHSTRFFVKRTVQGQAKWTDNR